MVNARQAAEFAEVHLDLHLAEIANIDLKHQNSSHSGILKSKQLHRSRFKSLDASYNNTYNNSPQRRRSIQGSRIAKNRDLDSDDKAEEEAGPMAIADISNN